MKGKQTKLKYIFQVKTIFSYFLFFRFYTQQRRNMKLNRYVTSSITTHMIADGLSCIGAILSQQKSLQVWDALLSPEIVV